MFSLLPELRETERVKNAHTPVRTTIFPVEGLLAIAALEFLVVAVVMSIMAKSRTARRRWRAAILAVICFGSTWISASDMHHALNVWRDLKVYQTLPLRSPLQRYYRFYMPTLSEVRSWIHTAGIAAVVSLASGLMALRIWRDPAQTTAGLCPTCSYDLTGNTSGICPECGIAIAIKNNPN